MTQDNSRSLEQCHVAQACPPWMRGEGSHKDSLHKRSTRNMCSVSVFYPDPGAAVASPAVAWQALPGGGPLGGCVDGVGIGQMPVGEVH
jgi:hypothetical protein